MNNPLKLFHPARSIRAVIILIFIGSGMNLFGCTVKQIPSTAEQTPVMKPVSRDYLSIKGENIDAEIFHLETQLKDQTGEAHDPKLLFHLALLYSSPHNPFPDHGKALQLIRTYMAQAPDEMKNDFEQYVMTLLFEIESRKNKLKQCKTSLEAQDKTNQKLKVAYDELFDENKNQAEIIEKLKSLGTRLEEKRKSID